MEQREKFENRKTSKREFMQKKRAQAVHKVKENHKRLKLSEVDKTENRKASKREFMQKKRAKAVNKVKDNHKRLKLSEVDKKENREASKREFMQTKRAKAVNKVKENHKRLKLSQDDKAQKGKGSKKEFMQKKRAKAVNKVKDNHERLKLSEVDKAKIRKASKREFMQRKRQNMQNIKIQKDTNNCISLITKFHENISCGPEYICTCCDQLWYKTSVRKCNTSNYSKCQKNLVQSCITGVKSVDNTGSINSETIDNDNDDGWCEVDERPSGVTDTLLQQPEVAGNGDNIISFAPGEGNKPLGIFMDKDSEFLSFPTIFCGKRRADNKKGRFLFHIVQ